MTRVLKTGIILGLSGLACLFAFTAAGLWLGGCPAFCGQIPAILLSILFSGLAVWEANS